MRHHVQGQYVGIWWKYSSLLSTYHLHMIVHWAKGTSECLYRRNHNCPSPPRSNQHWHLSCHESALTAINNWWLCVVYLPLSLKNMDQSPHPAPFCQKKSPSSSASSSSPIIIIITITIIITTHQHHHCHHHQGRSSRQELRDVYIHIPVTCGNDQAQLTRDKNPHTM